uniref:Uncharacterized protein n=1 Tax=Fagus sylvatica TaxID=28930 RepID=A0A2N9FHC5_FAGSY
MSCMLYGLWFPQVSHHVSQQTQCQLIGGCQGLGTHSPPPNHTPKVLTTKGSSTLTDPMVYGVVAQRSTVSTMLKSMISSGIESYGELVMVARLEEARGKRSWLPLIGVEGRRTLFSSTVVKDELSRAPLAADLEPLSGQLVMLVFGVYRQAVQGLIGIFGSLLLGFSCLFNKTC